jgi:PAS domain S-box-containing protein
MQWLQLVTPALGLCAGIGLSALYARRRREAGTDGGESDERRVALAGRLESFKHVIESAGIGTFFWDVRSDMLRWSERHYAIFEWPAGLPVTHAMFRDRVHPDDLAAVDTAIGAAMRSGGDYQVRFRLLLDGGAMKYIHGSGRVLAGEDGRAAGVHGAVIDVTEATQALHTVRQRELDLQALAASMPDIVSRFDRAGRCLFMSPQIEELTGRAPAAFTGKRYNEMGLPALLAARWGAVLEDVVRNRHVREFDFVLNDRHGEERFFITRALPSFDPEGKVATVLTVATDHTARERDARLVRETGERLREADVRKNEYLATLAHELRGPLAPIVSAAQLIKFSSQRSVRDKARDVIERQATQLANLVNGLMEVGRISSGKLDIERHPISIGQVIEQAVEGTAPLLAQKEQPLHCELPEEPVWVDGDAMRLTQVFSNLLTNASKYSPQGAAIRMQVGAAGDKVAISVRDEGIGLSAASMASIFDLFVQVHAIGVHAQGGLGIGLSLVRQLVELHGGEVAVASDGPGQGSCFTVTLPRCAAPAQAPSGTALEDYASEPLTILVVDDNVDGATALSLLLEALGHRALLVHNGLDAVALVARRSVDMVFLDLGLPDISGVQVALRIRGTPRGRKLPLIALTGLGRDEDRFLTRSAQFDEHVTKPLGMDDLLRITRSVAAARAQSPA